MTIERREERKGEITKVTRPMPEYKEVISPRSLLGPFKEKVILEVEKLDTISITYSRLGSVNRFRRLSKKAINACDVASSPNIFGKRVVFQWVSSDSESPIEGEL